MDKHIPVNSVVLQGNEKKYLAECIDTGWISGDGPYIDRFQNEFASYVGRSHGIAVSNGSTALDIAVIVAGIEEGDEVIMPTFTIISPALSVIKIGAVPVLIDSDPLTFNMDVSQIESRITAKTKAIIVVHIYGLPAKMDVILDIAKRYNLKVIEDAAEMHGQTFNGKKCGSFGDISTFSFYANKIITTGEGGMILCDDNDMAEHCKKLRNLAFEKNAPRFVHYELGFNYRMTNMQAALGVAQLEQVDNIIDKKRSIGKSYDESLGFLKKYGYTFSLPLTNYAENIYWVYGLVAPSKNERELLVEHLNKHHIGTRPFFYCMHKQPLFNKMNLFENESYPVAENLADCGFYIPSGVGLTSAQAQIVTQTIRDFYE